MGKYLLAAMAMLSFCAVLHQWSQDDPVPQPREVVDRVAAQVERKGEGAAEATSATQHEVPDHEPVGETASSASDDDKWEAFVRERKTLDRIFSVIQEAVLRCPELFERSRPAVFDTYCLTDRRQSVVLEIRFTTFIGTNSITCSVKTDGGGTHEFLNADDTSKEKWDHGPWDSHLLTVVDRMQVAINEHKNQEQADKDSTRQRAVEAYQTTHPE